MIGNRTRRFIPSLDVSYIKPNITYDKYMIQFFLYLNKIKYEKIFMLSKIKLLEGNIKFINKGIKLINHYKKFTVYRQKIPTD